MLSQGLFISGPEDAFIHEHFLLENGYAVDLYQGYAETLPVIDYHNHLSPQEIAEDKRYDNLSQIWLAGDHYKWRAMRANGVSEQYITGTASDWEKFEQWAQTVPQTLRNPLFHWTQLELKRYFNVDQFLNRNSAKEIYHTCGEMLRSDSFSVRNLLLKSGVESLCTTDDPTDDLRYHQQLKVDGFSVKILPTFRPDQAILIEKKSFLPYLERLGQFTGKEIRQFSQLLEALEQRMEYFHAQGCRIADHGLEQIYAADYTASEIEQIFQQRLKGTINRIEARKFSSSILLELGRMYHRKGWVQQYHLGALRNQNRRLLRELGPDTGFDSIGDFSQAQALGKFLDQLDEHNQLAKTILYNLNPRDNEVFAAMAGNFNDGTIPGKMQYGSAWWYLDQLDGMEKQINTLSNIGLLSRFVGMLTDSRSFLSFPRHEYFRRLLCNILGKDMERGHLPKDLPMVGSLVQNVCYFNAKQYFHF